MLETLGYDDVDKLMNEVYGTNMNFDENVSEMDIVDLLSNWNMDGNAAPFEMDISDLL